jgi:hypothetical protein
MTVSPLALTRREAAALCSLTPRGFDAWVRRGIVPGPIPGTKRWSRVALELALGGSPSAQRDNRSIVEDDPEEIFRRWELAHEGRA